MWPLKRASALPPRLCAAEPCRLACLTAIVEACPAANCPDKYGDTPLAVALVRRRNRMHPSCAQTYGRSSCATYLRSLSSPAPGASE